MPWSRQMSTPDSTSSSTSTSKGLAFSKPNIPTHGAFSSRPLRWLCSKPGSEDEKPTPPTSSNDGSKQQKKNSPKPTSSISASSTTTYKLPKNNSSHSTTWSHLKPLTKRSTAFIDAFESLVPSLRDHCINRMNNIRYFSTLSNIILPIITTKRVSSSPFATNVDLSRCLHPSYRRLRI